MLDTATRELRRGFESVAVEPQVLDLLVYLVENRDRVVSKDDLIASVWGGRIVSDAALTSSVYAARKAVGDSGRDQKLIRTISRKGLRFVGQLDTPPSEQIRLPARAVTVAARSLERRVAIVHDRPVIAVLPFTNMSDDPEQEYFSDGISEDLITALSKLRWFFVIARNSSFIYKGKAVHMKQVGDELGAGYVVEGSVRKSGDRVRITVQLNDVVSGSHVWAERYDRDAADVFSVQDEITEAIVAAIEPQLYAAENFRARRKHPSSMDAWELVMRAMAHYGQLSAQDQLIGQELLHRAVAIEPDYSQALGLLSASYTFSAHMGWADPAAVVPLAERAALAAVRIDGEDSWAHHSLGAVYLITRRFDDALAEFELALNLHPCFSHAQNYYASALAFCGRWREIARGGEPRAAPQPARSVPGAELRLGGARPLCRRQLSGGDPAVADRDPPAPGLCRRPSHPGRGGRHFRRRRSRNGRAGGTVPCAAGRVSGLDSDQRAAQDRCRPHPLSRGVSQGGIGITGLE